MIELTPQLQSMSEEQSQQQQQQHTPLSLPAPSDVDTIKLELNQTLRLDRLGPMIINSDGVRFRSQALFYSPDPTMLAQTVSRISNWAEMSQIERDRTMRILVKRNQSVASHKPYKSPHRLTDLRCVFESVRLATLADQVPASAEAQGQSTPAEPTE